MHTDSATLDGTANRAKEIIYYMLLPFALVPVLQVKVSDTFATLLRVVEHFVKNEVVKDPCINLMYRVRGRGRERDRGRERE